MNIQVRKYCGYTVSTLLKYAFTGAIIPLITLYKLPFILPFLYWYKKSTIQLAIKFHEYFIIFQFVFYRSLILYQQKCNEIKVERELLWKVNAFKGDLKYHDFYRHPAHSRVSRNFQRPVISLLRAWSDFNFAWIRRNWPPLSCKFREPLYEWDRIFLCSR